MASIQSGLRISQLALVINGALAAIKIVTGVFGNSYVLIADGIESCTDILGSIVVWIGLHLSVKPADAKHPFGHGKAESIAGFILSLLLLGAAVLIAVQSMAAIRAPVGVSPSWFTLPVLLGVIVVKEMLFRAVLRTGDHLESTALKGDAWHHRSDALTSAAAFVGIVIALIGGERFAAADDWASLIACAVIAANGIRLCRDALNEVMDASVPPETVRAIRGVAAAVEGVVGIDKCRIRKSGLHLAVDIHVIVDGELTVRGGHEIAHRVKDQLLAAPYRINDVTIHIEPAPDCREGNWAATGKF